MVRVKKLYVSYKPIENSLFAVTFSRKKLDESYHCYGFVDANGVEHDYAYIGMFHGSLINNKLRSIAGQTVASFSENDAVGYATANGSGWNINNYALINHVTFLLRMMWQGTSPMNSNGIGLGAQSANLTLLTGTALDFGPFIATANGSSQYRNKTFWIEGLVGRAAIPSNEIINGIAWSSDSPDTFNYRLTEPYDYTASNTWTAYDTQYAKWENTGYGYATRYYVQGYSCVADGSACLPVTRNGMSQIGSYLTRNGVPSTSGLFLHGLVAAEDPSASMIRWGNVGNCCARLTYLPQSN